MPQDAIMDIRALNIPGFQICQLSAYASITKGFEYARI